MPFLEKNYSKADRRLAQESLKWAAVAVVIAVLLLFLGGFQWALWLVVAVTLLVAACTWAISRGMPVPSIFLRIVKGLHDFAKEEADSGAIYAAESEHANRLGMVPIEPGEDEEASDFLDHAESKDREEKREEPDDGETWRL